MKKKSTRHTIGTILMLLGTIFIILAGVDSILYQMSTCVIVDGIIISYQRSVDVIIMLLSLLAIILGGLLRNE